MMEKGKKGFEDGGRKHIVKLKGEGPFFPAFIVDNNSQCPQFYSLF